jgi:hypothetical protein
MVHGKGGFMPLLSPFYKTSGHLARSNIERAGLTNIHCT